MKKILLSFSLVFLGTFFHVQATVPEAVKAQFSELYNENIDPVWKMQNDQFVALFQDREGMKMAFFTDQAQWVETKIFQTHQELPEYIQYLLLDGNPIGAILFCGKVYNAHKAWYQIEQQHEDNLISKAITIFEDEQNKEIITYEMSRPQDHLEDSKWSIDLLPTKSGASKEKGQLEFHP